MIRAIPASWQTAPAAYLDLLARHWADRDPAYAEAAAALALVAALRTGAVATDCWREYLPDWVRERDVASLVRSDRLTGVAAQGWRSVEAPGHNCHEPRPVGGWREVLLLSTVEGGWLAATACGCDCYCASLVDPIRRTASLIISVTPGPDLATVLRHGLTEQDRAHLNLPLPHEQRTVDDAAPEPTCRTGASRSAA